ncbi:hypothetical protein AHAS_Ahas07G0048800 [Arachis hypogaea]
MVECDSEGVVKLLNEERKLERHHNSLIRRISELKKLDWRIFFVHNYREGNKCADFLAKKSIDLDFGFLFWDYPFPELVIILQEDERGATLPRSICI